MPPVFSYLYSLNSMNFSWCLERAGVSLINLPMEVCTMNTTIIIISVLILAVLVGIIIRPKRVKGISEEEAKGIAIAMALREHQNHDD